MAQRLTYKGRYLGIYRSVKSGQRAIDRLTTRYHGMVNRDLFKLQTTYKSAWSTHGDVRTVGRDPFGRLSMMVGSPDQNQAHQGGIS